MKKSSAAEKTAIQGGLGLACLCAQTAADMRGKDTVVLDLTASTPIVDYFVITTATSARQMKAIASEINAKMKAQGSPKIGVEGQESSAWLLMDFGDIVLDRKSVV